MYLYCIVPIKFIYIAAQKYSAQPDVTGLCVLTMAGTTLWMVDSPRQVYLIKKILSKVILIGAFKTCTAPIFVYLKTIIY